MTRHTVPKILRPDPELERPLVVSIPHAGTVFPEDERPLYREDPERFLLDSDLYTDEIHQDATEHGATVITSPINRFVVDLNRLPGDLSPRAVKGANYRRGPGYYGDRGLIWALTTHGDPIYREPLTREVFERRFAQYYVPYHDALETELKRLRERFGYVILYDAHSMPSRASRLHKDPAGQRRPDIVPGDLDGRSCSASLRLAIVEHFTQRNYACVPNRPYRGGGITRRHGDPDNGIHAVQVELRRGLYMNEETLERLPGITPLRTDVLDLLATISRLDPRLD